jgi:hypothetical protein
MARSARVANLKLGKLIIHADNGGVAAKLRQITPTLVDVFHNEAVEVTGIEVKVQPRHDKRAESAGISHGPLGDHAKQGLTSLLKATGLPLRQALQHLLTDLRTITRSRNIRARTTNANISAYGNPPGQSKALVAGEQVGNDTGADDDQRRAPTMEQEQDGVYANQLGVEVGHRAGASSARS